MNSLDFDLESLDFTKSNGVVTVVAQDAVSGVVLMIAHANREALERTLESGEMHYTSRTRGLWHKGATSGNVQRVVALLRDCDGDAVLARVLPSGPSCHIGQTSCFGADALSADMLSELDRTIGFRSAELPYSTPESGSVSYTKQLLADRNLRLKKLGEESMEFAMACADNNALQAREEAADLFYHALVALRAVGASLSDVRHVLRARSVNGGSTP